MVTHLVNAGIVVILALSKARLILRLMAQKRLQAGSSGLTPLLWMWLSLLRRMRRLGKNGRRTRTYKATQARFVACRSMY